MCDKDCFNCQKTDCDNDRLDYEDFLAVYGAETEISRQKRMAKARNDRYRASHKEQVNARSREWNAANRERVLETTKRWSRENKQRVAAAKRKRWAENPEYYRQKQREYRARKKAERMAALA